MTTTRHLNPNVVSSAKAKIILKRIAQKTFALSVARRAIVKGTVINTT